MKLPQLTLRDLFWLVLVVAMGVALWIEHDRANAWQQHAEDLNARQLWGEAMTRGMANEARENSRRAVEQSREEQAANELTHQ